MNIGIFSKLGASGGSEHRAAEMASAITKFTGHSCMLLCENDLNPHIKEKLDSKVELVLNVFKDGRNLDAIYKPDVLLVINSDSYSFSKPEYWLGQTEHHTHRVDLSRIKKLIFLYNFVISPAKNLSELAKLVPDLRIVCANKDFFNDISEKDKFKRIRHLPRLMLESPIDPSSITTDKTKSDKIRIGKHSKAHGYKFNEQHEDLIDRINKKYNKLVAWDFLGVPGEYVESIKGTHNVTIRTEYSIPVGEYLKGIDIFLFFISWGRNEPWSRAVAEGMMAGCPILATNKAGNKDQVIHENTGYLCDNLDDFEKWLSHLIEHPDMIQKIGRNARISAMQFTSEKVIGRFMDFIAS